MKDIIRLAGALPVIGLLSLLASAVQAGVIAYDPFDTASVGNEPNGIYTDNTALNDTSNDATAGGNIIGFTSANAWSINTGSFFRPVTGGLDNGIVDGAGGNARYLRGSASNRLLNRSLPSSVTGTEVYASALLQMDISNVTSGGAQIGFTGTDLIGGGPRIEILWDTTNSHWDLSTSYVGGSGLKTEALQDNVGSSIMQVVWRMDSANDELDIWIDPAGSPTEPGADFSFTDFNGDITDITGFSARTNWVLPSGTSGTGFNFDEVTLGDTWQDVAPIPESSAMGFIALVAGGVTLFVRRRREISEKA